MLYNSQNNFKVLTNGKQLNHFKSTQIATINSLKQRDASLQMTRQATNINFGSNTKLQNGVSRPRTTNLNGPQLQTSVKSNNNIINSSTNFNNVKQSEFLMKVSFFWGEPGVRWRGSDPRRCLRERIDPSMEKNYFLHQKMFNIKSKAL